ncbi:MAG: terpene cyclase/mutase family protein [Planctomycetes bacterium]|nr:terpene cyclase/mutase family protein [Planctomycetota bacterium]
MLITVLLSTAAPTASAQDSAIRYGRGVPSAVRLINERSLTFLAAAQQEDGAWPGASNSGSGITGICVMAFMASGGDPDFGPHAENIRRALQRIIQDQDVQTGHIAGGGHGSMYHHGLAMLALSEAYGVVHDRLLWQGSDAPAEARRTVGQALELAVRCALTAQKKNSFGAWRYSPGSRDADTTVSGTVLMGLLGARNAGMEIPNEAVEKALGFFKLNTMRDGNVSYQPASNHGDGICRASIATVVFAVGKRKNLPEYKAAASFIKQRIDQDVNQYPFYTRYYQAQALFHSDIETWKAWNQRIVEKLQKMQQADGSISSPYGPAYGTGMSVLALALNYRLLPVYER